MLLYFLLVALGWMNIYAVVYSPDNVVNILSFDINSGKQLLWIGTSAVLIMRPSGGSPVHFLSAIMPGI